jgi:3-deoxy-7-phosphoheptulonate synthase
MGNFTETSPTPTSSSIAPAPLSGHSFISGSEFSAARPVTVGNVTIGGPGFTVIAGPCSIESKAQFLETALSVKKHGASLLRGGIWKLRTNPKAFQGLGESALGMVHEVLQEAGMNLVSEITDPRQVEALAEHVSMFQVGARNMHNYALLKELGQTKVPVMLKRNFSATIEEWIKAAEYISAGGNDKIILCERGIRTFETATRFTFDINAVVVAKAKTPYPVLVDPSHAIGLRQYVPKLVLASAAAGADGVIVEVHPHPEQALSDGAQSLTLGDFKQMMIQLEAILGALHRPLNRI